MLGPPQIYLLFIISEIVSIPLSYLVTVMTLAKAPSKKGKFNKFGFNKSFHLYLHKDFPQSFQSKRDNQKLGLPIQMLF